MNRNFCTIVFCKRKFKLCQVVDFPAATWLAIRSRIIK